MAPTSMSPPPSPGVGVRVERTGAQGTRRTPQAARETPLPTLRERAYETEG
jgi:hypothetical protein